LKIAIFTWDLTQGAFALGSGSYAKGFFAAGVEQVDVLYLNRHEDKDILPIFPAATNFVRLPPRHARDAPFALANYIKRNSPDLLISFPVQVNLAAVMGSLLAQKRNTKLIVSERSTISHQVRVQYPHKLGWRITPTLIRALYPHASGVACNSYGAAEDLVQNIRIKVPHERIRVIPPSIDLTGIDQWKHEPVDHPWFNKKESPVLICIARLSPEKNIPLLLDAFAIVRKTVDCRLLILGEGPERQELEERISAMGLTSVVSLLGYKTNPWQWIYRSDLFVLTSTEDAFARAMVDALACGTPVIATDGIGGGASMNLGNSEYGLLVPNGDKDALVAAILKVLQNPEFADSLRRQSLIRSQHYAPERIAQEWLDFAAKL
jgi:glycosyltransferase involved in cell wall biosynthesis